VSLAFAAGSSYTDPARRAAYSWCLEPAHLPQLAATPRWQAEVQSLRAECEEELLLRLRRCGALPGHTSSVAAAAAAAAVPGAAAAELAQALRRQIREDRGWWREGKGEGEGGGEGSSKAVYVRLLDGSLCAATSGGTGGGDIAAARQRSDVVVSHHPPGGRRGGGGGSALSGWGVPLLVRARSEPELATKVAFLGCVLQDPYWRPGGHAAALVFGADRAQRVGPFPGYCEQHFRYEACARSLELWHVDASAAHAPPTMLPPLYPDAARAPAVAAGPAGAGAGGCPRRCEWGALPEGAVVLCRGLWHHEHLPVSQLWFTIPRELPAAGVWERMLADLSARLEGWRQRLALAVSGRFHILCGRSDWDLPTGFVFLS
jgi:hypothetical protein